MVHIVKHFEVQNQVKKASFETRKRGNELYFSLFSVGYNNLREVKNVIKWRARDDWNSKTETTQAFVIDAIFLFNSYFLKFCGT